MADTLPLDRTLLGYLPPVLREVMEFQAINHANEPEIAVAWDALAIVLANQFLDDADVRGVSVWERELKIRPKDTDTLELRKARIKALWNMEIPYTLPWLRQWLTTLCGPYGHEETISEYVINIQLDYNALPEADTLAAEILDMLLKVRPSNMLVLMTAFLQSYGTISHGAFSEMVNDMDVWPLIVHDLESQGIIQSGTGVEYEALVDIWPHIVHSIESTSRAATVGALEYHRTVEIYPKQEEE